MFGPVSLTSIALPRPSGHHSDMRFRTRLRIVFISESWPGSHKIRVDLPKNALEIRGHRVEVTSLRDFHCNFVPDIAVFLRGFRRDVKSRIYRLRALGAKIIYDTDDPLDLVPKQSPVYRHYHAMRESVSVLSSEADLVTVSTERLAREFRRRNLVVAVLPNCVDPKEWSATRSDHAICRVGFQGGETHVPDLLVIIDSIIHLRKKHEFEFIVQGITPLGKSLDEWHSECCEVLGRDFSGSPFGKDLWTLLRKLKEIPHTSLSSVTLTQHPTLLRSLSFDIGLCPLLGTRFNATKSCLKYYEYAMSGAAVIASRVPPYTDELDAECTAVNRFDSWCEVLEAFLVDRTKRERLLAKQRRWVVEQRSIDANISKWESIFRSIL